MKPKILLVTSNRWFATARLAMAFQNAGCIVDLVCPNGHPAKMTHACRMIYRYRGLAPLKSIYAAIQASKPDLVVPCDDLARTSLHKLCARNPGTNRDHGLAPLLARSLGDPSLFSLIESRSLLIQLAQDADIPAPNTDVVRDWEELRKWIEGNGLPLVLKTDGTSGGRGVKTADTLESAAMAYKELDSPPSAVRAIKRAVADKDWSMMGPFLGRRAPTINVQKFVRGAEASITVACWNGRVLASIGFEVVRTWKSKGPASVVKLVEHPHMVKAAQTLAARLNLSGICGFDFVLEEASQRPHLIEMNPRATQTAHLAVGPGRNLIATLAAAVTGETICDEAIIPNEVVALFPLEWQNDSRSPYIVSPCYHDVPWEEPKLVSLGVTSKLRHGGWLTYDTLARLKSKVSSGWR